jgi:AcrR family transcriptional regulator
MKHSAVKQKIIETASQLFYERGYNLTGINEIIKEAGIAKATLYNHFKSKDDICIAYLRYKNDFFLKEMSEFVSKKAKGEAQLLGIFDFLYQFFEDDEFNGCWCIRTAAEVPKEKEHIKKEIQTQKNNFIKFIEALISTNLSNLNEKQVPFLAKQIYLLYESAISESHIHNTDWPIHSAQNLAKQIIAYIKLQRNEV